jgi:hypothetical protein
MIVFGKRCDYNRHREMVMEKTQSWRRLQQFNDSWIKMIPPGTSGVYVIHEFDRPLYVGRSRDIRGRLLDHLAGRGNRYVAMAAKNNLYLTFTYLITWNSGLNIRLRRCSSMPWVALYCPAWARHCLRT